MTEPGHADRKRSQGYCVFTCYVDARKTAALIRYYDQHGVRVKSSSRVMGHTVDYLHELLIRIDPTFKQVHSLEEAYELFNYYSLNQKGYRKQVINQVSALDLANERETNESQPKTDEEIIAEMKEKIRTLQEKERKYGATDGSGHQTGNPETPGDV